MRCGVSLPEGMEHQVTVFPSLTLPLVTTQRTLPDLLGSDTNCVNVTCS